MTKTINNRKNMTTQELEARQSPPMARLVFHPPPVTEARSAAFISLLITVILLFLFLVSF